MAESACTIALVAPPKPRQPKTAARKEERRGVAAVPP
jgi:hypothetical protein